MKDLRWRLSVILALINGEAAHLAARKPQATQKEYLLRLSKIKKNTVSAVPGNLRATPGPFIDCGIS